MIKLLGIGKFYPQESTGGTQNSNMTSSALFSTLSGQLNNLLSQVFDNNNWNIGLSLSYNLSSLYQNKHKMHEARQTVQLQYR